MSEDAGSRLTQIADELRGIGVNGLRWAANEYDIARYNRVLSLAAELFSLADTRESAEIERTFRGDLAIRTPFVGVDAAIFDDTDKLLLIQRRDNNCWAMPGGAAEVGEPPSAVAVREVEEETGLRVEAVQLLGVYDSHLVGSPDPVHLYHLVFLCRKVGGELVLTNETIGYGYFEEEQIATLALHRGHGFRITDAFKAYRGEIAGCVFQ